MTFGLLGASLARLFRRRATSVPPKIDPEPVPVTIDTIISQMIARGFFDVKAVHGVSPPVDQAPTVGIKPPPDPDVDLAWTWQRWDAEVESCGQYRGWTFCRFANRHGEAAQFVFGFVCGPFGVWTTPMDVCTTMMVDGDVPSMIPSQPIVACLTHLRSGYGIGVFADRAIAISAAELADRITSLWGEPSIVTDGGVWRAAMGATRDAWRSASIQPAVNAHVHPTGSNKPLEIWGRSIESINEGRPERLS